MGCEMNWISDAIILIVIITAITHLLLKTLQWLPRTCRIKRCRASVPRSWHRQTCLSCTSRYSPLFHRIHSFNENVLQALFSVLDMQL